MSVSTSSASVSRDRVSLILRALLQISLGLRSRGPEIGPRPGQGRRLQELPVVQRRPVWMRRWRTCSACWEEAEPRDRGHRTFVMDITIFFVSLLLMFSIIVYIAWHYCFLLLSIWLLTLLLLFFGVMALSYFVTVFCDLPFRAFFVYLVVRLK